MCNPSGCDSCCKKEALSAKEKNELIDQGIQFGFVLAILKAASRRAPMVPQVRSNRRRPRKSLTSNTPQE
jgi:hypothetical protein